MRPSNPGKGDGLEISARDHLAEMRDGLCKRSK